MSGALAWQVKIPNKIVIFWVWREMAQDDFFSFSWLSLQCLSSFLFLFSFYYCLHLRISPPKRIIHVASTNSNPQSGSPKNWRPLHFRHTAKGRAQASGQFATWLQFSNLIYGNLGPERKE